jgi:hypothetical protein
MSTNTSRRVFRFRALLGPPTFPDKETKEVSVELEVPAAPFREEAREHLERARELAASLVSGASPRLMRFLGSSVAP